MGIKIAANSFLFAAISYLEVKQGYFKISKSLRWTLMSNYFFWR
jgi:hypothetical protein